jgi:hypothetical protein
MEAFTDWRIATCALHRLRFNGEEASCPDCALDARTPPAAPRRWAGTMTFICPFSRRPGRRACITGQRGDEEAPAAGAFLLLAGAAPAPWFGETVYSGMP